MNPRPKILIVDDEPFNVDYLEQELEDFNFDTISAYNGREALEQVEAEAPDVILLDIMMPEMDGFAVLERLKASQSWRDIPVIVISAMNDIDSVVRGIKLGAADYLPKPFNEVLLHARLESSLERKRWRDKEVEYLRQVEKLTDAAQAIEAKTFAAESVATVAARDDALGQLARVFQHMAHEVHIREQRLLQQIEQLKLDAEEQRHAEQETVAAYIPIDRRFALAQNRTLPTRAQGAAMFADISGFTPLTEALTRELGLLRGAEELTRTLNRVYGELVDAVHQFGGSVINFSGDAITCWFDDSPGFETPPGGLRATACALAMQAAMTQFAALQTAGGLAVELAIKIVVATGQVRRFAVGDPAVQTCDTLAGWPLEVLAAGEHLAQRGEVLLAAGLAAELAETATVNAWRTDPASGDKFAVISHLAAAVAASPWPADAVIPLPAEQLRPWLLAPVYNRVQSGKGGFLSELRLGTALFLQFRGIDYENDEAAAEKLNAFVGWVQQVLVRHCGHLLQLTIGDKGSYLYAAFGAPVALENDAAAAVLAAFELANLPAELAFISQVQLGLARGNMRTGAYGGPNRRAYGMLGDQTNLAARLMQAAQGTLCEEAVFRAAKARIRFEPLPPVSVKGRTEPVSVYRPLEARPPVNYHLLIDQLPPGPQLTLKVASLLGEVFELRLLQAVYPVQAERALLEQNLVALTQADIIAPYGPATAPGYIFTDSAAQETAYHLMLFAQRRQLHREVATWYEQQYAGNLEPHYAMLARHWQGAENIARSIHFLEKAGASARQNGKHQAALNFYNQALTLEAQGGVPNAEIAPHSG